MSSSASQPATTVPPCIVSQADQTQWFKNEVHAHDSHLKAYLRGSFPSVRDVDDVIQESYLRIWRARLVRPIRSSKAFLFQIARHLAIDAIRLEKVLPVSSLVDLDALPAFEERHDAAAALSDKERIEMLSAALSSLPERTREIIFLRKFKNIPQKAVAAQFGIAERTVENHLARGMKSCELYFRRPGQRFTCDEK